MGAKALIKNIVEPRFFSVAWVVLPIAVVRVFKIRLLATSGRRNSDGGARCCCNGCPVQQFIEFTPVQPDATAGGAVVNFNALAIGHHQRSVGAGRAFHVFLRCNHGLVGGAYKLFDFD